MRLIFKILIGFSALFIASCSAFFSVRGLGLLFVGSATAVMVMAASLEVGKLIAASFLYQYWSRIGIPIRIYLMTAVTVLVGITSLGIYGYLARAYERTNSDVALLQQQIASVEREMADTQARIDNSPQPDRQVLRYRAARRRKPPGPDPRVQSLAGAGAGPAR